MDLDQDCQLVLLRTETMLRSAEDIVEEVSGSNVVSTKYKQSFTREGL
jgi:hypothetical protein